MINTILFILGLLVFLGEFAVLVVWFIGYINFKNLKTSKYSPSVTVIVPCKGIEDNFNENVLSICNQDYKNYDIIFVIDSKKDPVYKKLKELTGKKQNVKIEISEFIKGSSGKISALIKGVKKAGKTEVYVFADSDIKPHDKWLKNLVSPLKEKKIGATTGYRWYFPVDFSSLLLSVWNMYEIVSLFFQMSVYSWGGSTAIRKEVFDKLKIQEKWKKGISDDLILTNALRKAKLKIKFVPKCIVESPPEGNLRFIIKWGTRQLTWVKWYYPDWWYVSVSGIIVTKIATILGFILLAYGFLIPGLLMISTIFIEIITGGIAHIILRKLMIYPKNRYKPTILYAFLLPIILFILLYNNFASIFKSEIKWGGRTYKKSDVINIEN